MKSIQKNLFADLLPKELVTITSTLENAGFPTWLVGGAVRDILIEGKYNENSNRDFDFATAASPQEMIKAFKKYNIFTVPTGLKHGTITVVLNQKNYEITTFRIDGNYQNGRHPDKVTFSDSLEEDLSRRDFTINAMAYHIFRKELVDPFDGIKDLQDEIIRTVGNPVERFQEDGLRPIRACRFASVLNFSMDPSTLKAIPQTLNTVRMVSPERVREELLKMMKADKPSIALEYMRKTGIMDIFLPEVMEGYGIDQNEYHKYTVYYHNLYSCDNGPKDQPLVRLAALFHDIGKPRAKNYALKVGNGNVFYNHEIIGERMAQKILRRLKFSNQEIAFITKLIHLHMFYYTTDWTNGAVRRFLRNCAGDPVFLNHLFRLRQADRLGSGMRGGTAEILKQFKKRIDRIMAEDNALKVTDLDINGEEIMSHFDLRPSKAVGMILNELLEKVLDDPKLNQKEELLKISQEFLYAHPKLQETFGKKA